MVVKRLFRTKIMILLVIVIILTMALPLSAFAQSQVHVVQRGDTLYSIARRYGTTVQAIMSANGLSNRNFIWVGQRLTIPGTSGGGSSSSGGTATRGVYVVSRGDTLYSIARRYGTSVQAIMNANGLRNGNFIWVGQRLTIPGASSGGSSSGGGSTQGGGTIPASGSVHVVSRGETVASIARRYGTTVAAIATLNGLRNPSLIYVGQRLNIPTGGSSSSSGGGTTPVASGGTKWIDIDLSSQRLRAYAGNTVVRTMVVSTGIARYPTPPGRYRIYSKYPSITMSGPGYYLPGVPHSMFFYRGYAIHGTYWHNNFGTPMSHGCVNLTRADAAWLYSWSPIGTLVVIHW
jgi:LysM repeat protein